MTGHRRYDAVVFDLLTPFSIPGRSGAARQGRPRPASSGGAPIWS
jgi:hypothetical protein